jgi:hypothetical protein
MKLPQLLRFARLLLNVHIRLRFFDSQFVQAGYVSRFDVNTANLENSVLVSSLLQQSQSLFVEQPVRAQKISRIDASFPAHVRRASAGLLDDNA